VIKVTPLFIYKNNIFITTMMYNEKILTLLDALKGKLRILDNAANGAQNLTHTDIITTIEDSKKIVERVEDLVSVNH
jgi:hypothetical protein